MMMIGCTWDVSVRQENGRGPYYSMITRDE